MCDLLLKLDRASVLCLFILQPIKLRWVINIFLLRVIVICTYWGLYYDIVLWSKRHTSIYQVSFVHHHKILLMSQIIITNVFISHKFRINSFVWFFKSHSLLQTLNILPFQNIWLSGRSKQKNIPTQSKHWNTGLYRGSDDRASYCYNR